MKRALFAFAATTLVALAPAGPTVAQETYPSRPVRLIVSVAPGGGIDAVARLFAEKMSAVLGQTVVVENRAGAAGLIAGRYVANTEPDGYTVLVASNSMIISQLLSVQPSLDTLRDLQAVASVAPQATVVVAAPDLKINSLHDLVTLAKTRNLNYGSPGVGSAPHLIFEHLFTTLAGARMTHIPFSSVAQALTATMSSQIEVAIMTLPPAAPLVNSNKVKGVVVTTAARSAALPQVPTAAESGFPSINSSLWTAFFVPARTPSAVTSRLSDVILHIAALPDIREKLGKLGYEPTSVPGVSFQGGLPDEIKMWASVIEKSGIQPK